jgi:hypothetical protein
MSPEESKVGRHGSLRLVEEMVTSGTGEPDLVSCDLAHSYTEEPELPCHRFPEASKAKLQSLGLRLTTGFGEPDLASWTLVNSSTV